MYKRKKIWHELRISAMKKVDRTIDAPTAENSIREGYSTQLVWHLPFVDHCKNTTEYIAHHIYNPADNPLGLKT